MIAKPQETVSFPVNVTNVGDAPVRVVIEVVTKPRRLLVPEPVPIAIEPRQTASLSIIAQTPYENGRMDEVDSFSVRFTPTDPHTHARAGDVGSLSFTVRTTGVYVPAVGSVGMVLVGVSAWLRSRVR